VLSKEKERKKRKIKDWKEEIGRGGRLNRSDPEDPLAHRTIQRADKTAEGSLRGKLAHEQKGLLTVF